MTGADRGAPLLVRVAALASFSIGQVWLPLAAALAIVLVEAPAVGGGLAVLLVPMIVVLARTWWSGARLLRPDAPSQRAARDAARWLVHLTLPVALASVPLLGYLALRADVVQTDGLMLVALCAGASMLGLAHATLVSRATARAATLLHKDEEHDVTQTRTLPAWLERLLARRHGA